MKVKELKHILEQLDPNDEVVLAGDPEGNYFRAADGYSLHFWDKAEKDIHDEEGKGRKKAVVLWP